MRRCPAKRLVAGTHAWPLQAARPPRAAGLWPVAWLWCAALVAASAVLGPLIAAAAPSPLTPRCLVRRGLGCAASSSPVATAAAGWSHGGGDGGWWAAAASAPSGARAARAALPYDAAGSLDAGFTAAAWRSLPWQRRPGARWSGRPASLSTFTGTARFAPFSKPLWPLSGREGGVAAAVSSTRLTLGG